MNQIVTTIATSLAHLVLVLAIAPLVTGVVRKTKARFQNRRGASVLQPYFDLAKLFTKEVVISSVASWLFHATPYLVFGSMLVIALLVPTVITPVPLHWVGDIITVIYLFALGRFFIALAALDTGSAFGGLGSSREMSIASIVEPAMMLAIFTASVTAGSTNLSIVVERLSASPLAMMNPAHLLAFAGLFIVMIAETGRIPVDNPATHLELTMIHEAMILEYSGRHLALMEWAAMLKLLIYGVLIANLFIPWGVALSLAPAALAVGLLAIVLKLLLLGAALAAGETALAKMRLFRVPQFLALAFILCLLGMLSHVILEVR